VLFLRSSNKEYEQDKNVWMGQIIGYLDLSVRIFNNLVRKLRNLVIFELSEVYKNRKELISTHKI